MTGTSDVDAWFERQNHSMTGAARAIRSAILRAVPQAVESVKWQAPNFASQDDFATFSMRRPGILQIILHTRGQAQTQRARDHHQRCRWSHEMG